MPEPLDISAIIVSFNTRQLTLECLHALTAELQGIPSEIILVDNASTDHSVAAIGESFPNVTIIKNSTNRGFGAANNQAMQVSRGKNLLLLNTDAFPKPGAIRTMLGCMQLHDEVGVVGPKLLNADGSTQRSCFRFPSPTQAWLENLWITAIAPSGGRLGDFRRWGHDAQRTVDFVIGACMLVRRAAFEQAGGFDEKFFMYCEEADWQMRIRQAGWSVLFTPAAQVTHLGGASGAAEPARINRHFFDSLDYYQIKHHGRVGLILFRLAMIVGCTLRAPIWALWWVFSAERFRSAAGAKLRLRLWLIWRQATHWRLNLERP